MLRSSERLLSWLLDAVCSCWQWDRGLKGGIGISQPKPHGFESCQAKPRSRVQRMVDHVMRVEPTPISQGSNCCVDALLLITEHHASSAPLPENAVL